MCYKGKTVKGAESDTEDNDAIFMGWSEQVKFDQKLNEIRDQTIGIPGERMYLA